jgi:hypothetical protein
MNYAPPLLAKEEGPPTEKELNLGAIHIFTFPQYDRCGQAGFHHMSARSVSLLDLGWARAGSCPARGLLVMDRLYRCRGLRKRRLLLPNTTRLGHRNPRAPDNTYSSAIIHLIGIWHNDSTMDTRIIAMIILT